jgi:coenzyme F420-reducing hydrogenase alpha subunit
MCIAAAIAGSALIGGVASDLSSKKQAEASDRASRAQTQSNRENIEFQREVFEQQREDNAPWREIGTQSLAQIQQGIEAGDFDLANFNFEADPGYQFRKQEGINALDASASARGRLNSGAQDRAVTRYASSLASQEYQNAFSRNAAVKSNNFNQLATLANVGQVANQANQSAGNRMAQNVGQSTIATGNAIANNAINQGNARASAYQNYATAANQGIQNYLTYKQIQAG